MELEKIMKAIEHIKLERPSNDYVMTRVGDLEELYKEIHSLNNEVYSYKEAIESLNSKIDTLKVVAEIKSIKLDSYA